MKRRFLFTLICTAAAFSQNNWHVKPYGDNRDYSITSHDGKTIETAWTLQEALTNQHKNINPGDVVYLHGGIYQGHFTCTLEGRTWDKGKFITVKTYPGETAIINGNIHDGRYAVPAGMDEGAILKITGKYVQFENFRVTCLGDFTRIIDNENCNPKDTAFHDYTGILHNPINPAPCKFINLIIDNIPGVGFASWKETADTEIYGCLMYYNGYLKSLRKNCNEAWDTHDADKNPSNVIGRENCIYTQNNKANGKTRVFSNNIFSNNYKSGIAIWSAEKKPTSDYLCNYLVEKNIFINNAGPIRAETPNMLISSDTRNEKNFVQNITVTKNIFYFNSSNDISGISAVRSRNVSIEHNAFYHGTAAVELSATNKKLKFRNNLYVGKRIKVSATPTDFSGNGKWADKWLMEKNRYYTTHPSNLFLTSGFGGITLAEFQQRYKTESKSKTAKGKPPVQQTIFQNAYNPCRFHCTYYNSAATAGSINFDFSRYGIPDGTPFIIRDAEDYHNPVATGKYDAKAGWIAFPIITSPGFEMPRPSPDSGKTAYITKPEHSKLDFRVYVLEFECLETKP